MHYVIKKPLAVVPEEKRQGVESPRHKLMHTAIERDPAMLRQNHTSGCLPCQNGSAKIPQTRWWRKGTGAPPPAWHRHPTPPLPGTPPAPTGGTAGAQWAPIINLLAGYAYSHISHPCAECFNLDASAQDSQHDTDFNPHTLTDVRTSTSWYTISCVVMQLTFILKARAGYWVNLQVMTSIDRKTRQFGDYYYIVIRIIKEHHSE